jgi:hypothetical protein
LTVSGSRECGDSVEERDEGCAVCQEMRAISHEDDEWEGVAKKELQESSEDK